MAGGLKMFVILLVHLESDALPFLLKLWQRLHVDIGLRREPLLAKTCLKLDGELPLQVVKDLLPLLGAEALVLVNDILDAAYDEGLGLARPALRGARTAGAPFRTP
ncbi:MAG: hypothetical protein HW397_517 [Dehalococcoidia bacterium]|nr:hypothetical protein [Dehalococcoidia bacterium]